MSIKFFGASVIGVSASLGFNNQPSSLKVSLVEDLRGGDSFVVPTVGTPATFTIGSFTFGGLVQQWRKNRSTSGNPLYEINLVDPRELLEGVQVILSGYSGSVGISNVLNVYGYHESVAFGNAMVNDSGMSWNLIKSAVQTLTSGASGSYGGPIKLKGYSYAVDLSELPDAPSTFRIGGSVTMSLLEIINTVADAGGFDVYFTLNGSTVRVNKIDRYNQPPLGAMSAYVDQQAQAGNSPGANVGVEFRNETVASMVIGGPVELLHLTSNIVPYWGLDHEGNVIVGTGTGDNHTAELNSSSVSDITGSLSYSCKVEEMRMALFHQGMWVAYICANKPELAQILQFVPGMQINKALENIFARRHLINGKAGIDPKAAIDSDILMKQTRMYEFVKTQAETYYGKKYLVQLPDVQYRIEPDTLRTITSYEIGNAGYLPEGSQPLGLEEAQSDIFQDGESRYQPFARYGNSQDIMFQSIDPAGSWVKTDDNAEFGFEALFIKSETDPLIYIAQGQPKAVLTINRPPFIKSSPQRVFDFDAATKIFPAENREALKAAFKRASEEDNFGNDIRIGQFFAYATPEAVAVPLKSNISVYGPWYAHEVDGKVSVNNNPALTPWNFNGYSLLNQAGANESWGSVTKLQDHESGSIELAGVPTISLGGKLSEQGSNITSMDITYDAGQGYKTNYRFETFTPRFGTLSKIAQKRIETLARTQGQLSRQAKKIARDNKIKQAILQGAQQAFWENLNKKWKDGTPHDIFMGKIFTESDNTNFSSVSVATLEEVAGTLDKDSTKYQQCAAMSMDGLIRPFSTRNNDTYLPSYVAPSGISNGLTRDNLNPFIEDNDLAIHAHGNTNTGLLATQADPDNSRLLALRGPLVIAGWGYDLNGNIAPDFVNKQQKMSHWNAGPVDLLWDQYRGVWSCNNQKIGKADEEITSGNTGTVSIWDGDADLSYDLEVTNWSDNTINAGDEIILLYIPEKNAWFTFGAGSGGGGVTSVGLSAPSIFTVTGSPVTTTGTLTFTYNGAQGDILYADSSSSLAKLAKNTTATRYLANTGTSNNPAWDQVNLTNGVSNVLPIANGGTNSSTALTNGKLIISADDKIVEASQLNNGQLFIGSDGVAPVVNTLTAGPGITIDNDPGVITISAAGLNYLTTKGDLLTRDSGDYYRLPVGSDDLPLVATSSEDSGLQYRVLPIAGGGTNSSTSLNNNRIMVSSAGAIVEASALTNGQLLIGSTGAAPVAANIVTENGIYIVNSAGSIRIGKRAEGGLDSYAVNGGFDVVQRYDSGISNVIPDGEYGPDRWKVQRENADVEYERKDAVSETSLQSRYYGRFTKTTNAGKVFICQILSHQESMKFKGQICQVQAAMRSNASRSVRIAIYEWLGTADSVDTSISAWNGAGVAPTFTSANLVPYTPINNNSVTTNWYLFHWGFASITTSVKNIVFAIYTDDDMSVNDTLDIAQVTLLADTTAFTDSWQPAPEEIVLKQCQKYYQKSFDVDAVPEENAGTGSDELNWQSVVGSSSTCISPRVHFDPPMRAAPTVTLYNPAAANAEVRDESAAADCSASATFNVTKNGFNITTTTNMSTSAGNILSVNWSADAEL